MTTEPSPVSKGLLTAARAAILGNLGGAGILVLGCLFVVVQQANPSLPFVSGFLSIVGTVLIAVGSVWLGRTSAQKEAVAMLVPLAMPAFRHTFGLFAHLGRIRTMAKEKRAQIYKRRDAMGLVEADLADAALELIFSHSESALSEADTAFGEWEAIFPGEVKEFRNAWKE